MPFQVGAVRHEALLVQVQGGYYIIERTGSRGATTDFSKREVVPIEQILFVKYGPPDISGPRKVDGYGANVHQKGIFVWSPGKPIPPLLYPNLQPQVTLSNGEHCHSSCARTATSPNPDGFLVKLEDPKTDKVEAWLSPKQESCWRRKVSLEDFTATLHKYVKRHPYSSGKFNCARSGSARKRHCGLGHVPSGLPRRGSLPPRLQRRLQVSRKTTIGPPMYVPSWHAVTASIKERSTAGRPNNMGPTGKHPHGRC